MREIRLSGSEGGGAEPNRSLLPLSMGSTEASARPENEGTFAERRTTMGAAEMPAQSKATVSQVTVGDASCNEAPAKSEPLRHFSPEGGLAQALAEARECLRGTRFEPLIE